VRAWPGRGLVINLLCNLTVDYLLVEIKPAELVKTKTTQKGGKIGTKGFNISRDWQF